MTLLTVVLNGADHIRECIESVLAQSYRNVEYVIVDGGSSDGTLEILREYDARITYWESGRDRGIYDAMNRGLSLASGSITGIVGSDDALYPDAVESVVATFAATPDIAYTYGTVDLVRESGEVFGRTLPLDRGMFEKHPYLDMPFNHLSLFVRSEVYARVGGFNLDFPARADFDFVLRMHASGCTGKRTESPIGRYRVGGASDSFATCFETRRLMRRHRAPLLWTEWRCLSSIAKLMAIAALPESAVRYLTRLKKSRHVFY